MLQALLDQCPLTVDKAEIFTIFLDPEKFKRTQKSNKYRLTFLLRPLGANGKKLLVNLG